MADPTRVCPPRVAAPNVSLAAGLAYRRGVAGLLIGLFGFGLAYLGLLVGCVAAIVVALDAALREPWLWPVTLAVLALFAPLSVFLIHGLVRGPTPTSAALALDAGAHPRLMQFIAELAVDAGAPAPARVSIAFGVNAAMVRGHSPLGSVLGGRRELVLGLGLVNVLDLRELEAALAHEFGHFAQSSTRVGQWAHRVAILARGIVWERTRFDAKLLRLRTGGPVILRGAASALSVGVRGARGILAALIGRVHRLSLALTRELEFNADLHAVALCGSDPLVCALWRAQRGALAMNAALGALAELAKHGVYSEDLYAHHDRRLAELDAQLEERGDPMSEALRSPYRYGAELHFPAGDTPAQVMWYAHPSYREREANAKRDYVAVEQLRLDSAWSLFDDAAALRRELTARAYASLGLSPSDQELQSPAQVELGLAEELAERRQAPGHQGFYRNRIIDPGPIDALVAELEARTLEDEDAAGDRRELAAAAAAWRGEALAAFMARWRSTDAALEQARRERAPTREVALAQLEQLRAQELVEAHAGDRAIFGWLWIEAGAEARRELVERYRFLAFVQGSVLALNIHHAQLGALLRRVDAREYELASHAPAPLREALALLRRDLDALLDEAAALALPRLRNLEAGRPLADALLDGERVGPPGDDLAFAPWLRAFMAEVTTVHSRLRTLHFKNLGRLLALHDQICAGLDGQLGGETSDPLGAESHDRISAGDEETAR